MRAPGESSGRENTEHFALPASSPGLAADPPADQHNPAVQLMRAGG
jgi:hypothetical protein